MDLLLYLIQTSELDISKVSIAKITDQYLVYVQLMQELNFDTASEFLVMAATLLYWKSKAILPPDENQASLDEGDEDDRTLSQEDLVRQLLERRRFLAAAENFNQMPRLGDDVFTRANAKPPVEKIWREMDLTGMALAYQGTLVRARNRMQILKKETVSLSDKIREIAERLSTGKIVALLSLAASDIECRAIRPETVVTFLAALELSRLRKMRLYQEEHYSPIYVELINDLNDFDLQMASGFNREPTTTLQEVTI
ncbi:MAG: segregation/condensation protein A [Bdellovibrionota bacterium]